MFDKLRTENQLQLLRTRWLKEPDNRPIIEIQAKALKNALEQIKEKENLLGENEFKQVEDIFGSKTF